MQLDAVFSGRRRLVQTARGAAAFAMILLAACGPGESPSAGGASSHPASSEARSVQLLNPGVAPRQRLRYHPHENWQERAQVIFTLNRSLRADGREVPVSATPTVVVELFLRSSHAAASGELPVGFEISHPRATPKRFQDKEVATRLSSRLSVLDHAQGQLSRFPSGFTSEIDLPGIEQRGLEIWEWEQKMELALVHFGLPLPAEAVGLGAHWKARRVFYEGEQEITQVVTCELVGMDQGRPHIKTTSTFHVEPQDLQASYLPKDARVRLISYRGSGRGNFVIRLNRLVPVSMQEELATEMELQVSRPGKTQKMQARRTLKMLMEGL